MKTLTTSRAIFGLFATLGFVAIQSSAQAADMRDPICSTTRDVSNVFGQDSAPKVAPQCLVERKVSVPQNGLDVSTIFGNGSPAPRTPSLADAPVNARGKSGRTVEYVMGRAGGSEARPQGVTSDTLAMPEQR